MAPPARHLVVALTLALLGSSCAQGGGPAAEPPPPAEDGAFPVAISAPNGDVTIPARPERIVSLSPTSTEMLFAIDAGPQVVAVDDNSNYPPEAPMTDLSGFEPNAEAIAGYDPDLVVSDDPGDLQQALEALDIPVLGQPAARTIEDVYEEIDQLGVATGNVEEAGEVITDMRSEIESLVASVPEFEDPPTYYHELDATYFTATSTTFIGSVYGLAGLRNIADQAKGAASGYPQLSAEYIIDADPDLVFLADTKCCHESAATVADRPGWDQITAVRTGAVVELDDDIASRWGPRVVDFLRVVVEAVSAVAPA
jgi:cobalamin transport system substrate-binding protein